MDITGLTLEQFRQCANQVSYDAYGCNVIVHGDAHNRTASKDGTPHCTARLAVRDSRGLGSRTSWTGRHGPYACWHAYRDVLEKVFTRYPNAVIRAGSSWRVTYRGMDGFRATYPETGNRNVGSQLEPVTMPELCDCGEERVYRTLASAAPAAVATPEGAARIRELAIRVDTQMATTQVARLARETAGIPGVVLPERHHNDDCPDCISPAIERASNAYAASAKLLGEEDKPADPWVFGPEYRMTDDPESIYNHRQNNYRN